MTSKEFKEAQAIYFKLLATNKTIVELERAKDTPFNKVILATDVKNPVIATNISKKISNKICSLLLEDKNPLFDELKKKFDAI